MVDYLTNFDDIDDYNVYKNSSAFTTPNVSLMDDTWQIKHTIWCSPFNGYEYVDLGLPSGLLWATKNVGADSIFDAGWSFMWGYTTDCSNITCNWGTYTKFGVYQEGHPPTYGLNKYTGYNQVLEKVDDAASVNMRGVWRMPTSNEFGELFTNTTYNIEVVSGNSIISLSSNINGNKLYFANDILWTSSMSYYGALYATAILTFSNPTDGIDASDKCSSRHVRGVISLQ